MYFTGNNGYKNFLLFVPMLNFLILDSKKQVTNWVSTRILSQKIKPFNTNLEPTISNLANGTVNLKFNNSALVEKIFNISIDSSS